MFVKQWAINHITRVIREIKQRRQREPARQDFLRILPKRSVGVELGVFKGEFAKHILQIVRPKELHLIDPWWKVYGERYPDWEDYTDFGRLKTRDAFEAAKKIIEKFDRKKVSVIHIEDDLEYLEKADDNYFDWAYLDTTHKYRHTMKELELLRYKIKDGGMIVGHDYANNPDHIHYGVYKAVNEFCDKYNWKVVKTDRFCQFCIKGK